MLSCYTLFIIVLEREMLLPEQEKERNKIRFMIEGDIRKLYPSKGLHTPLVPALIIVT